MMSRIFMLNNFHKKIWPLESLEIIRILLWLESKKILDPYLQALK